MVENIPKRKWIMGIVLLATHGWPLIAVILISKVQPKLADELKLSASLLTGAMIGLAFFNLSTTMLKVFLKLKKFNAWLDWSSIQKDQKLRWTRIAQAILYVCVYCGAAYMTLISTNKINLVYIFVVALITPIIFNMIISLIMTRRIRSLIIMAEKHNEKA